MLKNYIIRLIKFSRQKAVISVILNIITGLTQGVGLLMILPLLQTLGMTGEGGESSALTGVITGVFDFLGLSLNIYTILGAYVVVVSLFAAAKRRQTVLNIGIQQGFTLFLRGRLYRALTYADWLFIARKKSSDITHAVTSDIQQVGAGTHFFLMFLSGAVLIVFHIAAAFLLSVPLTAASLVFGGLMALFMKPLNRKAYDSGKSFRSSRQALFGAVMEHLVGMKTAKSYGVEKQHTDKFHAIDKTIENESLRFAKVRATTRMFYEIAAVAAVAVYFAAAVKVIKVPLPKLLVLVFIFTRLMPRFSSLTQAYQGIRNMLPAFQGVTELQRQAEEAREFSPDSASAQDHSPRFELTREISFCDVSFRYEAESETYALHNASFDIPAQKITAVVGPSGAGKSTLADLLLGLLKPETGKITVDGVEITRENLHAWRHSVGYVPQETFLFNDTVRGNLLWALPSAKEEDLWEALGMAAAEDFVRNLPLGLDTVLGDRGITLSGGERQRIALARALLRKPRLLLLDEATSALDSENEKRIHQAIESLQSNLTIVIIAHRQSTIRRAHGIIVLDNGHVKKNGTWKTLSGTFL
jgi:ATP-binding cassette subfamily C protein